jgi:NAD(P) transhydrogenase subunit alpha
MKIAIVKERRPHETRVAATPETVKKLKALGVEEIVIEAGAGTAASYTDQAYTDAGAMIVPDAASAVSAADILFKIQRPMSAIEGVDEIGLLRSDQVLMSPLSALTDRELVQALATKGVTSFALELIPRITRAQSMDILSSQANLAGYKAVLLAANNYGRIFPQMMTPAGTLAPSRAFIMGVGVAGLQAIATARRLGAVVTAFDIRSAVKEQIQSLGAKFFEVEGVGDAEAEGGYARELTPEEQEIQRKALTVQMGKSDVIVTTALVPGRPAPKLVSAEAVYGMKPGSVIVDLAGEAGGNCELARPGETYVTDNGVTIATPLNVPSSMAEHASQLYGRNVLSLLELMTGEDGALELNFEDEVIAGACITRGGEIVNARAKEAAG